MATIFVYTQREDGFYRIGNNTAKNGNGFKGDCPSSITIPDECNKTKIIEIGIFAFRNADQLQSVILSHNIQIINNNAFDQCSLHSIELPTNLQYIGNYAFSVNKLEKVYMPKNVNHIGVDPFGYNTKLSNITIDPQNEFYATDLYGSLLNKQQTIFIQAVPTCSKVVIPHTVHTIKAQAFDEYSLTSEIIITGNIKTIGKPSFHTLTHLKTFVYYGYSPIPDDSFFDTIPEQFIVCNDYPGTTILGVNLN